MSVLKNGFRVFLILFGVFLFFFGGYDDSPGAQGLGLVIFMFAVISLIRHVKTNHHDDITH